MPGETTETLKRFNKIKSPDEIEYAGDYNLAAVILSNHKGDIYIPIKDLEKKLKK